MKFNPKEIQKFYDIWSPMLEALPAVINAAERGDEVARNLEILEKQLQSVQKSIADEQAKVQPVKKQVEEELAALVASKTEAAQSYAKYLADAKAHLVEVEKQTNAEVEQIKKKITAANLNLDKVAKEAEVMKAQAVADIQRQKAAAELDLEDISAKKQAVEKALASLKAKIG